MKLKVVDNNWKIRLLSPEMFIKEHGKSHSDSDAITDTEKFIVDFKIGSLTEVNVRHEVFHMYFDSLLVASANLTPLQIEEMTASLMGKYGEDYIKSSRKVWKWLNKQINS